MDDQSTTSISKGCFLFNANAKRSKTILTGCHFQSLPGETEKEAQLRYRTFVSYWEGIERRIDQVCLQQHKEVLTKLLEFVSDAHTHSRGLSSDAGCVAGTRQAPFHHEIPTAALVAGVNVPDHRKLFLEFQGQLHKKVTRHVVLLSSKDCVGGMKTIMRGILQQLMSANRQTELDYGDSDDEEEDGFAALPRNRTACSVSVLCSWYKEVSEGESVGAPVVLMVEDFERFVPSVMEDLFISLSSHLAEFPVVIVLGMATSVSAIHRVLSQSALSVLAIEGFHAQPAIVTFQSLLREILFSPSVPFKLGSKSLNFLLHQFFWTNFSINNVSKHVKFAVMEHFHWQPLSVLCGEWKRRVELIRKFSHTQCEMIRATPSFMRHVESLPPQKQLELLENDHLLKTEAISLLDAVETHLACFYNLLEVLYTFLSSLPEAPLGKKYYEVVALAVEGNVMQNDRFQLVQQYLRVLSKEKLAESLSKCITLLQSQSSSRELPQVLSQLSKKLTVYSTRLDELDVHQLSQVDVGEESTCQNPLTVSRTTSEHKMLLAERLRHSTTRTKKPSAYEKLKELIMEDILNVFKNHIRPPCSLPLHEICYFDQHQSIRKHLSPSPRVAILTALTEPRTYLPSASSMDVEEGISGNVPDICVAYQLYSECGKFINLSDWMQAFDSVVSSEGHNDNESTGSSSEKHQISDNVQARFIQAVSELQLLGFIKPTLRRTDHIQRLTWGVF